MLEIAVSNKSQWCDVCGKRIPKGVQFYAGAKVTMVGIVPYTEYVREHVKCEKYKDQPKRELTLCES